MKGVLQAALLRLYRLAASTGVMQTALGRVAFEHAYGLYKRRVEAGDIGALASFVSPDSAIIDAGAHIGLFSAQFAHWVSGDGRVYAFEPEADNAAQFERRIRRGALSSRIELIHSALSDVCGEAMLKVRPEHPGDHHLNSDAGTPVPVTTIDSFVAERRIASVSLIKIDVQGAELKVVDGAKSTIQRDRPALFIEVDDHTLRRFNCSAPHLLDRILELGYNPHVLIRGSVSQSLTRDETLDRHQREGYLDVLMLPRESARPAGEHLAPS